MEYNQKFPEEVSRKKSKTEKSPDDNPNKEEDENNGESSIKTEENTNMNWEIDNPYLAATKLPGKKTE